MKHLLAFCFLLALASAKQPVIAQDVVDGFVARTYAGANGATMPDRLFIPRNYSRAHVYPLIVYLHGGGGNGNDNLKQISGGNYNGTHVWTKADAQAKNPVFVLAPQAADGQTWGGPEYPQLAPTARMMLAIVDQLEKEFSIDADRLYLTGQSMGGYGTWHVIISDSNRFAAAVPMCGSGILDEFPYRRVYSPSDFVKIKTLPIWVFQGANDKAVPARGVRNTIATLRKVGSSVKYTEYPGVGHFVFERAYLEPNLVTWLFAQHR